MQPSTPDLVSLDLLLSVVELGSIGKAAAEHGMSQPSVSARLSRLERQLGVQVLVRETSGTRLTPMGEAVVAWASLVLDSVSALTDGVTSLRGSVDARLRVAASLTVAEYLMPPWLLTLRTLHPEVKVSARVANSRAVCEAVRRGEADVGFIESPDVPAEFSSWSIGIDRLALVASPEFARHLGTIDLKAEQLVEQPLLLREEGSGTRETFLQALAAALGHEATISHAIELGSTSTILATARAGGGVGVVSSRAVEGELAGRSLVELQVEGLVAERPLTAVWSADRPTDLAGELLSLAINPRAF